MGDMKLFLSLDNAVKVCCNVFDADKEDEIALRDAIRSIRELEKE